MRLPVWWQQQCWPYHLPFERYSQWTCEWPWPLEWANWKPTCDFLFVGNIVISHVCHHLWGNHEQTSQCTRFEFLTLKMKVKDMDDLDENLTGELMLSTCICMPKSALRGSAVCSWWYFVAYKQNIYYHITVQLHFKGVTRKPSIEAGIRRNAICYSTWNEI